MTMESEAQYDQRSHTEAYHHMQQVEGQSLADRKEAQANFLEAMKESPDLVAERLGWVFDGNYGRGEMLKARQIINMGKRANKEAGLTQLVAAYEWSCPPRETVAAWKKLSTAEKELLSKAIKIVIEAAEKEKAEQGW